MSAASSFAASQSQSVCQTTSFIGSHPTHGNRHDDDGYGSFAGNLFASMQVPLVPAYMASTQLTSIITEVGIGCAMPAGQSASPDSLMQLLQGLESEIAELSGELGRTSGAGHSPAGGLQGDYRTLYNEAVAEVQDGSAINIKLPSGETLSGKFSWGELEPAGDNALFTLGDPSAPDAGKQAFDQAIAQFLTLAQSDSGGSSSAGQIANYTTDTSFTGNNTALSWSGSFSLAPADAIPKA